MFQQRRTEAGGPRTAGAAGPRSGGRIVVDQLVANGIDAAFCVPGESFLAVLDALHDVPVRLVTCRHEAAAANMAVAYGKLTGRPGVCLVTRGPGATQASVGVHTAAQDSAPMLLLVGQVGRDQRGREAFQELDVPAVFGPMAKWAAEAHDPARLPELLARAVQVAVSGRPGPVVLALPEDVLDNRSPGYVGDLGVGANPALAERVRAADLLLVVGARLGEITTGGYRLVEAPVPRQRLVHVHPGVEELGRLYQPDLAVNAAVAPFVAALRSVPPMPGTGWAGWAEAARGNYLAWVRPWPTPGRLDLGQ